MSSLLINFWPIKSFLTYVFKRSFGKFLKNDLDLSLYDFTKKHVTFKSLDLNTQLINENLKDSPFKVICCNIGQLRILQPSLNFLTQKINIEISNVDLILMPTFSEAEVEKRKASFDTSQDQTDASGQAQKEAQKTEEFNILNNLVNKILQNLEVNVTSIAIRVLTKEISQEQHEIPTLLLRLNRVDYKRIKDVDPEAKPVSDTQVIFDGKCFEVGEISLHLMKSANLYPDEFSQKVPHQQKQKFPFEYPVINHPNTLLLIKPIVQQSSQSQQQQNSCISIKFDFPQNLKPNTLQITAQIPNIESIISFNQVKGILAFSNDIKSFYQMIEVPQETDLYTTISHKPKQRIDDDILDLYGTMIRTNQSFKETNFQELPQFKKSKSTKEEQKKPLSQSQITKKKIQQNKVQLRKEKLIYSFLQKTQDKKEFQKLTAELKQNIISQSQDDTKLLESSVLMSSVSDNSKASPMLEVSTLIQFNKLSVFFVCNENEAYYDHVFDSISNQIGGPQQQQASSHVNHIDDKSLKRQDQKIPFSHYNLELRNFMCQIKHKQVKLARSKQSSNPFSQQVQAYRKEILAVGELQQLSVFRYDILGNLSKDSNNNSQDSAQNENMHSNSSMFHSAAEFYQIEEAKSIHQSQSQLKRGSGGQSIEQSHLLNHDQSSQSQGRYYYLFDAFKVDSSYQHYCSKPIVNFLPILKQEQSILSFEIFNKITNKEAVSNGKFQIGNIKVDIGWEEILTIIQLSKQIDIPKQKPKHSVSNNQIPNSNKIEIEIKSLSLNLHHRLIGTQANQILLNFLNNQPINQLNERLCVCQNLQTDSKQDLIQDKISIELKNPSITITDSMLIQVSNIDLIGYCCGIKIPLISIQGTQFTSNTEQSQFYSTKQKEANPYKMFEDEQHSQNIPQMKKKDSIIIDEIRNIEPKSYKSLQIKSVLIKINMTHLNQLTQLILELEQSGKSLSLLQDMTKCYKQEAKQRIAEEQGLPLPHIQNIFNQLQAEQPSITKPKLEQNSFQIMIDDVQVMLDDTQVKQNEGTASSSLLFSQTIPLLLKKSAEIISIQPKKDNHIADLSASFNDELNISAPFIIIYKQQGIQNQNSQITCPTVNLELKFQIQIGQNKHTQIKNELTQALYPTQSSSQSKVLQTFAQINQLKRNPMISSILISLKGIVLVLPSQFGLLERFKTYRKDFKTSIKEYRIAPPKIIEQESIDKIKVKISLSNFLIDYSPALTKENYNKIVNRDAVLTSFKEDQTLYKTSLRAAIYLSEMNIKLQADQDRLKEQSFNGRGLQLSILENNIFTEQYNPVLLIDTLNSLDQTGGNSLLDKLGFIQVLTVDVLEVKNIITIEDCPEDQQNNNFQQNDYEEEEEEDLFQTSYGLQTIINKSKLQNTKVKKQDLNIIGNKICLYLAKDSFNSAKILGKIIDNMIDDINKVTSIRKKKRTKAKKNIDLDFEDQYFQDGFQQVLEQFLFMDYDEEGDEVTFKNYQGEESKEQQNQSQTQSQYQEQDLYYFKLNQINNAQEILVAKSINLNTILKPDYIPELNQNQIDQNRYKNCHLLPKELQQMKQIIKISIEVHSIDFKLYEGLDFNYNNAAQASNLKSQNSFDNAQQSSSNVQSQLLFNVDEDYLTLEKRDGKDTIVKKVQSSKRPKASYRGNYFQLYIKNLIFSYGKLIDSVRSDIIIERYSFSIEQLMIRETLSKRGSYQRELLQLPYDYQYDNQIQIILQRDIYNHCEEHSIKIKMQPFKLILNQALIAFSQEFFNIEFNKKPKQNLMQSATSKQSMVAQSTMQSVESKPIYIRELKIYPLQAILSYSSDQLNFFDLTSGNKVELLNIFNIRDLKLNIKEYDLQQKIRRDQAFKLMLEFYKDDLVKNQKISFVKALGPLRSFVNVAGAFYGVFKKPYIMYSKDQSVVKGIGAGIYGLFKAIGEETSYITSNVAGKNQK